MLFLYGGSKPASWVVGRKKKVEASMEESVNELSRPIAPGAWSPTGTQQDASPWRARFAGPGLLREHFLDIDRPPASDSARPLTQQDFGDCLTSLPARTHAIARRPRGEKSGEAVRSEVAPPPCCVETVRIRYPSPDLAEVLLEKD